MLFYFLLSYLWIGLRVTFGTTGLLADTSTMNSWISLSIYKVLDLAHHISDNEGTRQNKYNRLVNIFYRVLCTRWVSHNLAGHITLSNGFFTGVGWMHRIYPLVAVSDPTAPSRRVRRDRRAMDLPSPAHHVTCSNNAYSIHIRLLKWLWSTRLTCNRTLEVGMQGRLNYQTPKLCLYILPDLIRYTGCLLGSCWNYTAACFLRKYINLRTEEKLHHISTTVNIK